MNAATSILYQLGLGFSLLAAGPFLLARRGSSYLPALRARLGLGGFGAAGAAEEGPLWLHAVSVGEVGVAATLAAALPAGLPLLVTTVTPTGQERARQLLSGRAEVAYLPFDLAPPVRSFLRRHRPRALVLVEGDYWPLLLHEVQRRGLPVAVVNGRVGDRSFRRMRRLRSLAAPLFSAVQSFGLQSEEDLLRLLDLGVERDLLTVTGNLKYDSPEPLPVPLLDRELRELAAGRPILLAGSTVAGEEPAVLEAFRQAGGPPRALLVLAPRHPERWAQVAGMVRESGLACVPRSGLGAGGDTPPAAAKADLSLPAAPLAAPPPRPPRPPRPPDVVLLDSLGELAAVYRLAAAAFVGGSLVPRGGHNPLEAARFGVPLAVGPSMENFRDMAGRFDSACAWRRVADAAGLAKAWTGWLDDPEAARRLGGRGKEVFAACRGAVGRTLAMLAPLLAPLLIQVEAEGAP